MNKVIKLAFFQSMIEIKAQWKTKRWLLLIYAVCIMCVVIGIMFDGTGLNNGFWAVYILSFSVGDIFRAQEKLFPGIFAYLPMNDRQKAKYLICRISVGSMLLFLCLGIWAVIDLAQGRIFQREHLLLLLTWIDMILFIQLQQITEVTKEARKQMDQTMIKKSTGRMLTATQVIGILMTFPVILGVLAFDDMRNVKLLAVIVFAEIVVLILANCFHMRFIHRNFSQVQWR